MRYLLDTNAVIGALRGHPRLVAKLEQAGPDACATSSIVAYEIASGILRCAHPGREREKAEAFLSQIHLLPFDLAAAQAAADIRTALSAKGTPIGPYDLLIAGHAAAAGLILVTHNTREFARVKALPIEDWH